MAPTLMTKSSDINAPRFSIVTKALAGTTDDGGHRRFKATASSTITDRVGDEISLKALQQMAAKFREGVTIFTDHENRVGNAFGTTDSAEIIQRGSDPKTGQAVWDLDIAGPVNEPNPNAVQLHDSIAGGYVKLGCSIDAFVLDHARKKGGGLAIEGLDVFAASIVGVPMNQRSWTQKAVRAIKSFQGDPDEEDDVVTKEANEGLELQPGDVGELVVHADGTSESAVVAKAGTPEAENWLDANATPTDLPPVAGLNILMATTSVCPECGQSADTTGCPNGYHSVEQSTEDSTSGVQESSTETPETALTDTVKADTPVEEKAAGVSSEVAELLGHVRRLVTEIGGLRAENAKLVEKVASLELANQSVQSEIVLAKEVIAKVMEQPLRAKTAGYVQAFTATHGLFDPEVEAYLNKRGIE